MESAATTDRKYYVDHAHDLKRKLATQVPKEPLKELHRKRAWRHFVVLGRQLVLLGVASWMLWRGGPWWLWIPFAFVQGFTIFNFTVLLHEVVHNTVFATRRPKTSRFLGLLYGLPSGLSASQFRQWHLDHHDQLGSEVLDPKRHYLSPRINARWYKLLYFTPALFPIYFRAAAQENATYPPELRRAIRLERLGAMALHLGVLAALWIFGSFELAIRVHAIPVFVVFPIAFVLNRLGQHYDIVPENVANWSTLMKSSPFWNFAFLWSNFHLEHHYFPAVPFYNLPKLHRLLQPFYASEGIEARSYGSLLWNHLVRNKRPHTNWGDAREMIVG